MFGPNFTVTCIAYICLQDAVAIMKVEEEADTAARKLTETAFFRGSVDNIICLLPDIMNNPFFHV